jgi:hypothetical protein
MNCKCERNRGSGAPLPLLQSLLGRMSADGSSDRHDHAAFLARYVVFQRLEVLA